MFIFFISFHVFQTCVFVSSEQQRRRVGVDQELHVVQSKLLDVVPELVLLIHTLEKSQGGRPHLKIKITNRKKLHKPLSTVTERVS